MLVVFSRSSRDINASFMWGCTVLQPSLFINCLPNTQAHCGQWSIWFSGVPLELEIRDHSFSILAFSQRGKAFICELCLVLVRNKFGISNIVETSLEIWRLQTMPIVTIILKNSKPVFTPILCLSGDHLSLLCSKSTLYNDMVRKQDFWYTFSKVCLEKKTVCFRFRAEKVELASLRHGMLRRKFWKF